MQPKDTQTKRILLIEDEVDLRVLYAEVLTEAGYVVEQASEGEMGLEKILKYQES